MADITALSNQLDAKKYQCRAIIETPKGCRNKFDYDPDSSLFILGGLLPEGMMFPFDFGFIPSTLGDDGVGRVIVAHPALWVFNARPHRFYLTERGRDKSLR
jgi:Inorganic pyrophosphatase